MVDFDNVPALQEELNEYAKREDSMVDEINELRAEVASLTARAVRAERDTERLDWLEANCDMILNHEQLTQDEYRSPTVVCCLPEDRPLRESIDAWLRPRPATP